MNMKAWLGALICIPTVAWAGIPVETSLTCPIGGEQFTIIESGSCSNFGERTMAFTPISTCDFVTRLPQCPQNRLPLYKDYSEEELDLLRGFIQSETYDSMVDRSRFYMAYIIERQLGNEGPGAPFWLLLQGLWYDGESTFSDPDYLSEFLFAARAEIERESDDNRPYLQSIAAFAQIKAGDFAAARVLLQAAEVSDIPILQAYHRAMAACMADADSEFCNPQTPIVSK